MNRFECLANKDGASACRFNKQQIDIEHFPSDTNYKFYFMRDFNKVDA